MRKLSQQFLFSILISLVAGLAYAEPEALPDSAKVTCTKNNDGTGTLTITGVDVKRVEMYIHKPVSKKSLRDPAENYNVPANATFNFVFKNTKGEDRFVAVGDEGAAVAKVFATSAGSTGTFIGVIAVPDARHGGIGGPGASMGCAHMLRAKTKS